MRNRQTGGDTPEAQCQQNRRPSSPRSTIRSQRRQLLRRAESGGRHPPPEIATEKEAIVSLLMPWNPKKLDPVPRERSVPVTSNVKVRPPLSTKVKMAVVSASAPPEFEVVEGVAARETERQCL